MGGSSWSDDHYASRSADRVLRGAPVFKHDADVKAGRAARAVHDRLNPLGKTRESRDSAAHPNSNAIGVMFDVTGSMGEVPAVLQKKLPQLMAMLLRKGYVDDPQILMGAVGDANSDRGSLQVGQFESGVEMDEDLEHIWLEGGGGGSQEESYQNAMYFFARHTVTDCFEKRGKRGYLFIIGDERAYPKVKATEVKSIIGDTLQADIPIADMVVELRERWNVFFVIPQRTSHGTAAWLRTFWEGLLGAENVLELKDPDAVCECIALAIGLCEGTVDLDAGVVHAAAAGASASTVGAVRNALDPLARRNALARVGTGTLPERAPNPDNRL